MEKTVQDQLMLEMEKLDKLEKQEHQWISQANPILVSLEKICSHMKILLDTVKEKKQLLGPNMSKIVNLNIHQKLENLSTLTTLIIDIQKEIHAWGEFQHQLEITAESIMEFCIHQQPSIRKHSP